MKKPKKESKNLRLAGLFTLVVIGLIIMSLLLKIIFIIRDSHFDGSHKFNIVLSGKNSLEVVSFSPANNSLSVLKVDDNLNPDETAKVLKIPVDGIVKAKDAVSEKNISSTLFKAFLPLGNSFEKMTVLDLLRTFLFSRGVSQNEANVREFKSNLTQDQKSTLINLSFTDPAIYQENQSIEVINAADIAGLGSNVAQAISNIGGNVILVSTSSNIESKSRIIYYGDLTYTDKRLNSFLGIPLEKTTTKGIADVIIILGKDMMGKGSF